jgi:hypothetical protein
MDTKKFDNGPLPASLKSFAYISPGGKEFGLPREKALEYLTWCDQVGLKVLGFDVWIPTKPNQPTIFRTTARATALCAKEFC